MFPFKGYAAVGGFIGAYLLACPLVYGYFGVFVVGSYFGEHAEKSSVGSVEAECLKAVLRLQLDFFCSFVRVYGSVGDAVGDGVFAGFAFYRRKGEFQFLSLVHGRHKYFAACFGLCCEVYPARVPRGAVFNGLCLESDGYEQGQYYRCLFHDVMGVSYY